MKLYQIVIFIVSFFGVTFQKCGVTPEFTKKFKIGKINTTNKLPDRFLQTTSWTPIKIYVDYTSLEGQFSNDQIKLDNIKSVMSNVVSAYTKLLSVKSTNSPLVITDCTFDSTNSDSYKLTIDPKISSQGVDADLILFPFLDPKAGSDTQAWAAPCPNIYFSNNRPMAGLIGFGDSLDFSKSSAIYYNSLIALHEVNHILAFNSGLFELFVDADGKEIPISDVVKKYT